MEWQDISTAPKDKRLLVFEHTQVYDSMAGEFKEVPRVLVGWWRPSRNQWVESGNHMIEPTHWQPLPPPPASAATASEPGTGNPR